MNNSDFQPSIPWPTSEATEAARELRKRQTPSERLLWTHLRNRQVQGLKFRRQAPIGPYVVDFCCLDARLIVELDGKHHDFQREYDEDRSAYFEAFGFRVLRFRNEEVIGYLDAA